MASYQNKRQRIITAQELGSVSSSQTDYIILRQMYDSKNS